MARASKFPYGSKYDQQLRDGEKISRARYREDIRLSVENLLEKKRLYPTVPLEGLISELAFEITRNQKTARDILSSSKNWNAIDKVGGVRIPSKDAMSAITAMAYWAYRTDMVEYANSIAASNPTNAIPRWPRGGPAPRAAIVIEAASKATRDDIIDWLQWADPNGVWSDEDMEAEGWEPMTLDEAMEHVRIMASELE